MKDVQSKTPALVHHLDVVEDDEVERIAREDREDRAALAVQLDEQSRELYEEA